MSNIDQIQKLADLAQSFQSLDLTDLISGISQQISAQSASTIASAVTELKDAGLEPSDYIPMSRAALRSRQQVQRMQHEAAMQALELRQKQAEVVTTEAMAKRLSTAPVPAPPQQPVTA
jgi:hypothetical protein